MSDKLTNEEQFNEYWKDAVGKPPYTHAKAIAKHAWDAGQARLPNAQGEAVAWMVTTSQWPTIQDEEVRFVPHMEGLKQNERWTPLCLCDNPAPMPDSLPDEPTEEMIDAMCKAATDCEWPQDFGKTAIEARQKHARAAYKAMLRAHMGRKG